MDTAALGKKKEQPPWNPPKEGYVTGLKVNNSLTSSNVPFIPIDGKRVGFYVCGPTVYDSAHMGHARNYITFDIIRRILEDYFNYEVFAVMNITDVDDKIILKARRNFLFQKFQQENPSLTDSVFGLLETAWTNELSSLEKKLLATEQDKEMKPQEKGPMMSLLKEKAEAARQALSSLRGSARGEGVSAAEMVQMSRDPLSVLLDAKDGHSVTDPKIFRETAAYWEKDFMEDMRTLGIRMPDVLTRVTEYIPEVIELVKGIIANGFAYVSNESVYFDTVAFSKSHSYGKLEPWAIGNLKLIEEGEGALSLGGDKKNPSDFAVWKKSKPGEPFWDSPWGQGRPGWHIECSAMAADHLGQTLDIHGGGEDLKFPHHDNELAQSEGFYNSGQWVNYFLHSGHLHINGLKMSKSLKNFITIRQALQDYTARQLRLLFLMKPWDRIMNYVKDTMDKEVKAKEKTIVEFFLQVKNLLRDEENIDKFPQNWRKAEKDLHAALQKAERAVDSALKDNFDTPAALEALLSLISEANVYLKDTQEVRILLLKKIATFITKILRVFGLVDADSIGFAGVEGQSGSFESKAGPYIDAFLNFRKEVREAAKAGKPHGDLLSLSDKLRDEILPPLGLKLTDSERGSVWDFVDAKQLLKEAALKKAGALNAAIAKLQAKLTKLDAEIEKFEAAKVPPENYFSKTEYSQFDKDGIPTHTANGEINKSTRKKLDKAFKVHTKNHQQYLEKLKDPDFLTKMKQEREQFAQEIQTLQGELKKVDSN